MSPSDSAPIISPTGIIHVLGYTPTEGERGVPITVRIHFHPDLADAMYVRLVVGSKAVPTKVRLLPQVSYGRWQLHAAAPPFEPAQHTNAKVLISVQALNEENTILDSVTFGEFTYWTPGSRRHTIASGQIPRLQIPERRRSTVPSPSASENTSAPFRNARLHRRVKPASLVRTKQSHAHISDREDLYAQTPVLDLVTPLSSICAGWSQSEINAGRRLVRFSRVQDGRRLIVSCETILQEDYCENDSVISCIYRPESETCYVTSVDVIYLLERLTNGEFPVEEKNRIRRNLEGLRPTTVSKHKPGFGDFFQRIMDFPDPKPRNIEKDLKVFEWNLLGQALEKILSKYSIYTSPTPESTEESSPTTHESANESPELYALQLSYPPPEDPGASRFLDQKVPKFEPYPDDFSLTNASHADGAPFPSPVDSVATSSSESSSHVFPLFSGAGDTTISSSSVGAAGGAGGDSQQHSQQSQQHPHQQQHWASNPDFKSADLALENFNILSSYEVVEPGGSGGIHNYSDNAGLDFNLYENYGFQGHLDETLSTLAEQYSL